MRFMMWRALSISPYRDGRNHQRLHAVCPLQPVVGQHVGARQLLALPVVPHLALQAPHLLLQAHALGLHAPAGPQRGVQLAGAAPQGLAKLYLNSSTFRLMSHAFCGMRWMAPIVQ